MNFRKKHPPVGSRPGTLAIADDAQPTRIVVHRYTADEWEHDEIGAVSELAAFLEKEGKLWVDVQGFRDEARLREIGDCLGLHPLVLEDAVNVPQRAKSEPYSEHHLIVARVPVLGEPGRVELPQISILFSDRFVVTFQERYLGVLVPVRERMEAGTGRPIRRYGSDYLAYVLLDTIVDHYYPVVEGLSARIEALEEETIGEPSPDTLSGIHQARREVVALRRVVWPQRSAVNDLLRNSSPFVTDEVKAYLRDTHDHIAQIADTVDSARDMTMALMDIYLSNVSHRTNEIMKVLTLMASIFIPLTFLAGIYGMNFEYMPELQKPQAYPLLLATMFAIAAGMVWYFRRRGWISGRRRRRP